MKTMKTRQELESEHVAAGVAKWGESERAGLERQARAKSLETLRMESDLRTMQVADATESQIRDHVVADTAKQLVQQYQAAHCNEDGVS